MICYLTKLSRLLRFCFNCLAEVPEQPISILLEGDLAGDLADEVLRHVELLHDVLSGVDPPGDGELDVAADVGAALARGTAHLSLRLEKK